RRTIWPDGHESRAPFLASSRHFRGSLLAVAALSRASRDFVGRCRRRSRCHFIRSVGPFHALRDCRLFGPGRLRPYRPPAHRKACFLAVRDAVLVHHLRIVAQYWRLRAVGSSHPMPGLWHARAERARSRRTGGSVFDHLRSLHDIADRHCPDPRPGIAGALLRHRLRSVLGRDWRPPAGHRRCLCLRKLAPSEAVEDRPVPTALSNPAHRGAPAGDRTDRTVGRGRYHLFRAARSGQSRLSRGTWGLPRLVFRRANFSCAWRTWRAGIRFPYGTVGDESGWRAGGPAGIPPALSDSAPDTGIAGRYSLRTLAVRPQYQMTFQSRLRGPGPMSTRAWTALGGA